MQVFPHATTEKAPSGSEEAKFRVWRIIHLADAMEEAEKHFEKLNLSLRAEMTKIKEEKAYFISNYAVRLS